MSSASLRAFFVFLLIAGLIALAGCGTNSVVCPTTSLNSCSCGNATSTACLGNEYVYAAGLNGQLTTFTVSPQTGALLSSTSITGPQNSFGITAMGALYVAEPVGVTGSSDIQAWSIDMSTGGLTPLAGSPFLLEPFSIAGGLAANTRSVVIYVADAGKVDALKADPMTGALSPVAGSPFAAGINLFLAIDPEDRYLVTSDGTPPGYVDSFTIDASTGVLTPAQGSPFAINPAGSQPEQIAVDQTGNFVYVALGMTNQIAAFQVEPSTGVLTPVPGSPFSTGFGTLTLIAAGKFLYVPNVGENSVSGYSIDQTTGVLSPLSGSPFAIPGGSLTADPTGRFLYISGGPGMSAYSVDQTTGALTQIGSPVVAQPALALTFVP